MLGIHAAFVAAALCGSGQTVLLDFYSDACPPCRAMMPTVDAMAAKGFPVQKVNVAQRQDLAQQFRVSQIPCFVMVVDGREVDRVVGMTSPERLEQMCRMGRAAPPAEAAPLPAATPLPEHAVTPATYNQPAAPATYREQAQQGSRQQLAQQQFVAAAVRLRVRDAQGHSCGSGTIIDARNGEALILTCGHIFRDSQGQGPIEVDLFGPQPAQQLSGQLIGYSEKRDLGLVSIRVPFAVTVMPVADENVQIRPGDPVVTVGCNNGGEPSVHATRITSLDKFLGPPNIQVADLPVEGRSGGGLFTPDGHVIGVCNAADPADREGLYAALASIHDELDRLGLTDIYRQTAIAATPGLPPTEAPPAMPAQMPGSGATVAAAATPAVLTSADGAASQAIAAASDGSASQAVPLPAALRPEEQAFLQQIQTEMVDGAEVICVIRTPQQRSQVLMLQEASPELLQVLSDAAGAAQQPHYTSLAVPAAAPPSKLPPARSDVSGWAHSATQQPRSVRR